MRSMRLVWWGMVELAIAALFLRMAIACFRGEVARGPALIPLPSWVGGVLFLGVSAVSAWIGFKALRMRSRGR